MHMNSYTFSSVYGIYMDLCNHVLRIATQFLYAWHHCTIGRQANRAVHGLHVNLDIFYMYLASYIYT